MLDLAICNELLSEDGLNLREQAALARDLGYAGLEVAPFTLGPDPDLIGSDDAAKIRAEIEAEGVQVTGLHWLLTHVPDVSIIDPERQETAQEILIGLAELCAALGGRVLVHGSPPSRVRPNGIPEEALIARLAAFFAPIAERCGDLGLTYCIEPLAESETIHTVAEGAALVDAVGHPAFLTMIDCSAAGQTEPPVADLIRAWAPTGKLGHIHANDSNRGAPGMGDDPFCDIVRALVETGWPHPLGVEPFRTLIDARITATTAIATLRACERACA
ncbi:sugar phosphate isomerase/epimerase family protein [Roseicyclus sp. F158]|uniref:Sugar phosphate isomerase/epimerase family protein n=1 Tax=Tropicimonas omnivorans TaxID=3075590 RepID=A0ABU3DG60_9RHOB|nr:sugar phosphate isomerase/epimerase family protein [Roseicyclus sp. F158]MDT0682667.1 sugar phosphate isomerase/epimerase family protein [Roseicyclus sp. F158]